MSEGEGEEGSHGVVSVTVTQSVPEDFEAEAWSTSLCLRGEGGRGGGGGGGGRVDSHGVVSTTVT